MISLITTKQDCLVQNIHPTPKLRVLAHSLGFQCASLTSSMALWLQRKLPSMLIKIGCFGGDGLPPTPGVEFRKRSDHRDSESQLGRMAFICSRPPLVVGHPQLNLLNRALGTRGKTVQAPQPSISILFSLPTAAHSGPAQPVLTSSAQTEQRRIFLRCSLSLKEVRAETQTGQDPGGRS